MSIIHEALKKAQIRLTIPSEDKKKTNILILLGIGFVFLGFLGCGFALMLLINSSRPKTFVKVVELRKQLNEKKVAINLPLTSKPDNSQLVLNGIISMEGNYLALINNQILKEGDYVQGMRIINITKDKVELYSQGKLTALIQK